jgi:glycosyltransferase involved in cell wall biosynthesis
MQWELKGGIQLLSAFKQVKKILPDATLTIVGCKPEINIPGVHVIGAVPQIEIPKFLGSATMFCLPSLREAFGIAYLEAMRAGLPVIASHFGAAPDFIINGKTGFLIDPFDIDDFSKKIVYLLTNVAVCEQMSVNCRDIIQNNYTWELTQQKMEADITLFLQSQIH